MYDGHMTGLCIGLIGMDGNGGNGGNGETIGNAIICIILGRTRQ